MIPRPLPDERPRQSVANLIGRFEQQHSKRPSASSSSPRTSSVISHNTGDSAKEELKERREWPPPTSVSSSQMTGTSVKEIQREKKEWPPRASTVPAHNTGDSDPLPSIPVDETSMTPPPKPSAQGSPLSRESSESNTLEPVEPAQDVHEPAAKQDVKKLQIKDYESHSGPSQGPGTQPIAKIPASKSAPTTSITKNAKSAAKTPLKPSLASFTKSSSMQQLKSERHDRKNLSSTSVTTFKGGRQSRPSSRTTIRSKTPSAAVPSVPRTTVKPKVPTIPISKVPAASARPKTPAGAISKTPSTGLYAPTAASLAKARNAPSPQPDRKKPLSQSISLDRLSKPTASSLSKARNVIPTTSPPRKSTTVMKPRASAPTTIIRKKPYVTDTSILAAPTGELAVSMDAEGAADAGHGENGSSANGHDRAMLSDSTHPEIVLSDVEGHDHGESEILSFDDEESYVADIVPGTHEENEVEGLEDHDIEKVGNGIGDKSPSVHHADDDGQRSLTIEDLEPSVKEPNDDIEDMVNLLESSIFSSKVPFAASVATVGEERNLKPGSLSVLDHAGEIPDEE